MRQAGATLHRGARASHCRGLSLLRSTSSRRASSVVVAHRLSCSAACGIFPDQGSNPCPLHWQTDSQPLRHQGSPLTVIVYPDVCLPAYTPKLKSIYILVSSPYLLGQSPQSYSEIVSQAIVLSKVPERNQNPQPLRCVFFFQSTHLRDSLPDKTGSYFKQYFLNLSHLYTY